MAYVDETLCTGCGVCLDACATGAISLDGHTARIDPELCTDCGKCVDVCVTDAIVQSQQPDPSPPLAESPMEEAPALVLAGDRPARGSGLGSGRGRGQSAKSGRGTGGSRGRGRRGGRVRRGGRS